MAGNEHHEHHEASVAPISRAPFDPSYKAPATFDAIPPDLDLEAARKVSEAFTAESILAKYPDLRHRDVIIPPIEDLSDSAVTLALFETKTPAENGRAAVLFAHGGAQVMGTRFFGVDFFLNTIPLHNEVLFASVEYRLAPEHRAPSAAHDFYAAAVYLSEHASELGIDPTKLIIVGVSGGAVPAAAACLLARDRSHPPIRAQMLSMPMLDDCDSFASQKQFASGTNWTARRDRQAWDMVLGPDRADATGYQVPGRANELSGLPPTFLDVGECDVLRDSTVSYASRIWSQGGSCELHVWPGMYHYGIGMEPEVGVSKAAAAAERNFFQRVTGLEVHELCL